jgi:hypothetical protein
MHPYAQKAAEAAECANDQGKFWEYHDLLFQNQSALSTLIQADPTNGVNQAIAKMKEYAATVQGIDTAKFDQCLDSGANAAKVTSDAEAMTNARRRSSSTASSPAAPTRSTRIRRATRTACSRSSRQSRRPWRQPNRSRES